MTFRFAISLVALLTMARLGRAVAQAPTPPPASLSSPPYYQWRELAADATPHPPWQAGNASVTTWVWMPAATFIRVRTDVAPDALQLVRVDVSVGGYVTQRLPVVPIDGGVGIWHMAGTGAYLGISAPGIAHARFIVERAMRRQPAWAVTQLRLGLWSWLFRGQAFESALLQGSELQAFLPLAQWAKAHDDSQPVRAAIWDFFVARSLGTMASSADTARVSLVPTPCLLAPDGTATIDVSGPAWVRISAHQPVATWKPWLFTALAATRAGPVVRGEIAGLGSVGGTARLLDTPMGDTDQDDPDEQDNDTAGRTGPSRALVQTLWLPDAKTQLTLRATTTQGPTAACFAATATRLRSIWFTPSLRPYPVHAARPAHASRKLDGPMAAPAVAMVIAEAMSAGSRALDKDDARLVDMWAAFYALLREPNEQGRDAALGMALLIAEQSQTLAQHEAERLMRVTAKRPWGGVVKALVAKRLAIAASITQAHAADGASPAPGEPDVGYNDILGASLASALRTPADKHARDALLAAWRNGRWTLLPDFTVEPLASGARVTVLSTQDMPVALTDTWFVISPGQAATIMASAPEMSERRTEYTLMAKWRVLIRSSRPAITLQIDGQPHTLAVEDGVAIGEWILPLGTHTVHWDGAANDSLYSSLPSDAPAAMARTTAQLFTHLRCDATWTLAAPSLPYLRISATSAGGRLPTVHVAPDRGEAMPLTFSPRGEMSVTTQGVQMLRPMSATLTLPSEATSMRVTCDGASDVWLSIQQRGDTKAPAVDELALALAMLRLPEPTPAALRELTTALRITRDATTLAKRAYLWWMLGQSELARFDALSAQYLATTAEKREIRLMLAPLNDEAGLVQVPPLYQAWASRPQQTSLSRGRQAVCNDTPFGGDAGLCMQDMLAQYRREHHWPAAIVAAKAYLTLTKLGDASPAQSLAIFTATTAALRQGFHPALQWARSASARGTTRKLITAVDDSAGSMPIVRTGDPLDVETGVGARVVALDAPWDPTKGLIVLDHGAGAALRLTGGKPVRVGLWCQPLRDDVVGQPSCKVSWRLNQRPVQMLSVAPRTQIWHDVALPPGTSELAFDLVAPTRDRLVGIVVFDGQQPIVGQTQQKAFRTAAGHPVVVRVAGPTVVTVERVATGRTSTASVTATVGQESMPLAEAAPVEIPIDSDVPQQLTVTTDGEAAVLVRVRIASQDVHALPPLANDDELAPRVAIDLPQPIVPAALPEPRAGRIPTFTARFRVGIERQDQGGSTSTDLGSGEVIEIDPTMASASVVETRLGMRRRVAHGAGQTWLALDGFTRAFNSLPNSPGAELTLDTRWWRLVGLHASGRYTYATTGLPEGIVILGQAPRSHVGRVAMEAYGLWTSRQWLLRPSLLYRNNWADDQAVEDVDLSVWNSYVAQMPSWYEGALLLQWAPSLDSRVTLTPRVRWANDRHMENVSARLRLSGLLGQRRWGGVYLSTSWQPQYWVRHADALLLRLDPYFAHQTSFAVDFLRQWQRQWWLKLGFRASVQYVKGRRDVAGWVQFELTKSQRQSLNDMLPSEQEFDQLTGGRVWADEKY